MSKELIEAGKETAGFLNTLAETAKMVLEPWAIVAKAKAEAEARARPSEPAKTASAPLKGTAKFRDSSSEVPRIQLPVSGVVQ